jgi:hypothetical protein
MEDSEIKIEEKAGEEKTPAVSIEMVRHNGKDTLTKRIRGEGGKFVKQPKTMPKSLDVTRLLRTLLNQPVADENGKMTKGGLTRLRKMFDNIYQIAIMPSEQPLLDKLGNPMLDAAGRVVTIKDAKIAMASVQAWKELMLRAHGMPSKSDEELESMKTQAVKVVILQHPDMMDKNIYEEKPRETLKPAFIDAEIIENK